MLSVFSVRAQSRGRRGHLICAIALGLAGLAQARGQVQPTGGTAPISVINAWGAWAPGLEERVRTVLRVGEARLQMVKVDTTPNHVLAVRVVVDGTPLDLDLAPHSVRAPTYQIIEHRPEGYVQVAPTPLNTLRGAVRGVEGSIVAGGVMPDGLYATIILPDDGSGAGERRYWIQPATSAVADAPAGLHVVYRNADAVGPLAVCTTVDVFTPTTGAPELPTTRGAGWRQCLVAVDDEFQYYRQTGSSARSQDMINLVFNIVNVQYEREVDIRHLIGTIIVRTFQNYNPASMTLNMRQQFQNWWNANHGGVARDLAVMFDGNGNGGQTAGGAAICNLSTAYSGCGVDWPNLSYRTDVVSHEIGHAWSACHCPCNSPPYTMDPFINYSNRFFGAPTNECASNTIAQIVAHRNSRPIGCLDFISGPGNSPNDSCANALPIPCNDNDRAYVCTFGFSNFGATRDGPVDGCRPGDADIWYTFTGACSGLCSITTCGNTFFDTVLFVYNTGSCNPSAANLIACSDDDSSCSGNSLASTAQFFVTTGSTYLLRVAGFNNAQGAGILTIRQPFCGRLFNDSCVDAPTVRQGENIPFSTVGALTGQGIDSGGIPRDSYLETACNFVDDAQISNDIWFRYVSPCAGTTRFSLCGSSFDTKIAIYGSCPGGDNQSLACNDDSCSLQSSVDVSLGAGVAVLIRIGGYRGAVGAGTLRIDSLACPLPANDRCSSPITLFGISGSNVASTIMGAYNDGSSSCGGADSGPDVWYRYTAPCDGTFTFSTCGTHDLGGVDSGVDTVISFHSGCPGTIANQIAGACNDDAAGLCGGLDQLSLRDSYLSTAMTAGQTVYIRAATFNNAPPTRPHRYNFAFTTPVPDNDECAGSPIIGDGVFPFCTLGAHQSAELPGCASVSNDIWYLYVAPCTGTARASLCGSAFDTLLAVFDTSDCSESSPVVLVCNDDNGPACAGTQSSGDFPVLTSTGYIIRVSGFGFNSGGGVLTMTCTAVDPVGACCSGTSCSESTLGACAGAWQGAATTCQEPGNPITCCPANFNRVGGLGVQDIFDYLAAYFGGDPAADFNGSGTVSVQDIFDFLAAFFAGCA